MVEKCKCHLACVYLTPILKMTHLEFHRDLWCEMRKLEYQCHHPALMTSSSVFIQHTSVTDRQTDRQTHCHSIYVAMHMHSVAKVVIKHNALTGSELEHTDYSASEVS